MTESNVEQSDILQELGIEEINEDTQNYYSIWHMVSPVQVKQL